MKEEPSDLVFMSQFQSGDKQAFEKVWADHYARLRGYAEQFTIDKDRIEEAVAKAFLGLSNCRERMKDELQITKFLFVATRYACIDGIRASKRHHEKFMAIPDNALMEVAADESAAPDHRIIRAELRALLYKEINSLPDKYREALQLYVVHEKSVKVISDMLGIGIQTVRDRINGAIRKLRLSPLKKQI